MLIEKVREMNKREREEETVQTLVVEEKDFRAEEDLIPTVEEEEEKEVSGKLWEKLTHELD